MSGLAELLAPSSTAVVTMEMQRGVIGDLASIPALARAVREVGLIGDVARMLAAGRAAGVTVCHAMAEWRADRAGMVINAPLLATLAANPDQILAGSPAADLVSALGPEPTDLVSVRRHGLTPFTGTDLDMILRNSGVRTIVATGVSVNVGVLGLVLSGVDLGYHLVVPTDAVAGVPPHYAAEVLHHTVSHVATLCSVDDVIAAWS